LGVAWAVLTPTLILGIYSVLYLVVFPFHPKGLTSFEYTLYILAGLAPFLVAAEALSVGVGSIVANKAVLSNVVFPIDLVPAKAVLGSLTTLAVASCALFAGAIGAGTLSWTIVFVPVLYALFALGLVGIVW